MRVLEKRRDSYNADGEKLLMYTYCRYKGLIVACTAPWGQRGSSKCQVLLCTMAKSYTKPVLDKTLSFMTN